MIYTRGGAPAEITEAECRDGLWFVKAKLTGKYPDGSGQVGASLFNGYFDHAAVYLVADEGWSEIEDACKATAA